MGMENIEDHKKLISQGINIFNSSSPFFNDICFHFESPNGKDVPLKERILTYFPNIKLCDDGCQNRGIDREKYEVICECTFSNIINNNLINNVFTGEVIEIVREMNIEVLKCYQDVFKFEYFKKNYGGIMILVLILIQGIINIIYFCKDLIKIKKFTFGLINSYYFFYHKMINDINQPLKKVIKKGIRKKKRNKSNPYNEIKKTNSQTPIKDKKKNTSLKRNLYNKFPTRKMTHLLHKNRDKKDKIISDNSNKEIIDKIDNSNNVIIYNGNIKSENKKYMISYEELEKYIKKAPNEMEYEEALLKDKRTFFSIYIDFLYDKQIVLNIILEEDKYKPKTIKYIIYFLSINLYFVINGLFFSESYIDELFKTEEEEKFFSFIPRSIKRFFYTYLVGSIVNFWIEFIIISGNKIKSQLMKTTTNINNMREEITKILFKIERSINAFLVVNYFIMIISWYYISCFNNVYSYTKIEWIKSSIFIIIIMQIEPFIYTLGLSFLRYISLRCNINLQKTIFII